MNTRDDEDIYPNPDIIIEYAVDISQNKGDIDDHWHLHKLEFFRVDT